MKTLISFSLVFLLSTASAAVAQTPSPSPGQPVSTTGTPAPAPPPAPSSVPAPATSAATSVARGAAVAADYRLGPGDKLRIEVYKDAQLSQALQVRPDGKITLPLVGDLVAAGRTPVALRDSIAASLKEFVTNPVVTVIVTEIEAQTVSVMGEVERPGPVPIKGRLSVLEALAVAGGFKDFANTKNITIRRPTSSGVQIIRFNYKDAVKGEGQPVYLQPGDIIIVP